MAGRCATSQPPETVPESGSELLELHGVDEGVDGGVGVAEPEHKSRPAVREGNLYVNKIILTVRSQTKG